MTHRRDINASHARLTPDAVSEFLTILTSAENPLSGILTEVLNAAMLLERQHHHRADSHERTDERNGYANGYKERTLKTRLGTVLGVTVALGEHEIHWRAFMEQLVQRGLTGVRMITSDDHAGLRAARKAIFGGVPWQRCQFHIQQNALAYVPRDAMKPEVTRDIKASLNAPDMHYALEALKQSNSWLRFV